MIRSGEEGWFTRERILTFTLASSTFLFLYLSFRLIETFVPAIAFAIALAVATQGPYNWLRARAKSDTSAALLAVLLITLLILGPAAFLGTYIVQKGIENVNELRSGAWTGWHAAVERQPILGPMLIWSEQNLDLAAQLQSVGEALASQATGFLRGSVTVITQLVITLFVLFFLFRDRKIALNSLCHLVPLSQTEANHLFTRLSSTIRATVNGSLTVAFVQSLLAGIMYAALGVPGAVLWGAVTFIAALVPVFGTVLIWGPVALYLLLTGSWIKAMFLVGWGMLAVGMIDNLLYPFLVGDKLRLHTVPTFFSILGGITLFGPVGLILGPLILAITIALLDIWWMRTSEGHVAEEEVTENNQTKITPGKVLQEHGVHRL